MATQVFPTKGNLIATKKSLSLASLGYDLMDRKRNILVREMMLLIEKATSIQSKIDTTYDDAYAALQKANITLGFCGDYAESIPVEDSIHMEYRSVMGVEIPIISLEDQKMHINYGLSSTNSMLDEAYLKFHQVKLLTVQLAEVESSVYRLANAIRKAQKRANALKNIMIPQFETTVKYITEALEEKEREDFSRLKVIKAQKERQKKKTAK